MQFTLRFIEFANHVTACNPPGTEMALSADMRASALNRSVSRVPAKPRSGRASFTAAGSLNVASLALFGAMQCAINAMRTEKGR